MKKKKKINIVLYTILMALAFVVIAEGIIWGKGGELILKAITQAPQGFLVVSEAVLAAMTFIVMLLFKNSYVFTQKKESLGSGLFCGLFLLMFSGVGTLVSGILERGLFQGLSVINLIIGCLLIGICEEFLCRGWLLNEFLERYGESKKGIWYSIIISSTIFGLMHLGNILNGQDVIQTLAQVINAFGIGMLLGVIYYKTKNIWSVIILHGFWDFSIFLSDIVPVTEATESTANFSILSIVFTILIVLSMLINIIPYFKNINIKPKKGKVITLAIVSLVLYFIFSILNGVFVYKFGDTYKYDSIKIGKYSESYDNYDEYYIKYDNDFNDKYNFVLSSNKDVLTLKNLNTNYAISIECNNLFDYLIVENENYFIIGYFENDRSNKYLKYVYLNKDEMNNSNEYLDNIKSKFKKYLLPDTFTLMSINDVKANITYLTAYNVNYGYLLLTGEDKMALLNRE